MYPDQKWSNLMPYPDDRTYVPTRKKRTKRRFSYLTPFLLMQIDTDLRDLIASARKQDRVILDALEALKTGGTPPMKSLLTDWRIEGDLIFYKDRCYVPDD